MDKLKFAIIYSIFFILGVMEALFIEIPKAIIWTIKWTRQHPESCREDCEQAVKRYARIRLEEISRE